MALSLFLITSHNGHGTAGCAGHQAGHRQGTGRPALCAPSHQHGKNIGGQTECGVGARGGSQVAHRRQQQTVLMACGAWVGCGFTTPAPKVLNFHRRREGGHGASAELCGFSSEGPSACASREPGVSRTCLLPVDRRSWLTAFGCTAFSVFMDP